MQSLLQEIELPSVPAPELPARRSRPTLITPPARAGVDRRLHRRLTPGEVKWLQSARIKYGAAVDVLDISERGIRIATAAELNAKSRLVLELIGADRNILMTARVLRSEVDAVDGVLLHRGNCSFDRPLILPDLSTAESTDTADTDSGIVTAETMPGLDALFQKVIARFHDGRLLRGYTNDFHSNKPHLHLSENPVRGATMFVPLAQLKALFFVRDFAGNPGYIERKQFEGRTHGRKIEVTFTDGEVLIGSTLNFRPERDAQGFFVHPADSESNNLRIFVSMAAIRHVRFL